MRLHAWCAVAALAVGACRSNDASPPPPRKFAEAAFRGPKISLPALPFQLSLGMTETELRVAAPADITKGHVLTNYYHLSISAELSSGHVVKVRVLTGSADETRRDLATKWGAPRTREDQLRGLVYYWEDRATGLRAELSNDNPTWLEYTKVMSLEQLLGTGPDRWGFETTPLLGASRAEIMEAYPQYRPQPWGKRGKLLLSLPGLAGVSAHVSVFLSFRDDKVIGYELGAWGRRDASINAAFLARLEQRFGKGTQDEFMTTVTHFPTRSKVTAVVGEITFGVDVGTQISEPD